MSIEERLKARIEEKQNVVKLEKEQLELKIKAKERLEKNMLNQLEKISDELVDVLEQFNKYGLKVAKTETHISDHVSNRTGGIKYIAYVDVHYTIEGGTKHGISYLMDEDLESSLYTIDGFKYKYLDEVTEQLIGKISELNKYK